MAKTATRSRSAEAATDDALVRTEALDVAYGPVQVLFGVDFEVEQGEILALLGTNGAGKSTLLRAISGTQEADDGAILLEGRDITHMPPAEIVQHGAVLMPGGRGVFPGLTVEENLRLATWLTPDGAADAIEAAYERFPVLRQRRTESADVLS